MLFSIRKGAPANLEPSARPVDLLLACHARIRRFTRLARDLIVFLDAPPADVAEAASALVRYHRFALPLHEADEDLSLRPRLEAIDLPDAVAAELVAVADAHRRIDALIAELIVGWSSLAEAPTQIQRLAPALAPPTAALVSEWEPHLAREESIVFPAIGLLPPEVERALWNEIRTRRATSLEGSEGAGVLASGAVPSPR